jgi:hypothetical protein
MEIPHAEETNDEREDQADGDKNPNPYGETDRNARSTEFGNDHGGDE